MSYRILVILAHPDDEVVVSGTLARYAANGSRVQLVSATRGEVGEISSPELATRENLGDVRTAELEEACRLLGIGPPRFLGFRDSGMAGSHENDDPRALVQADPALAVGRILALFHEMRPHIVITGEPGGWYGHPDHIAVSRHITAAYDATYNAAAHRGAGYKSDGQDDTQWRPQRLFYAVVPWEGLRVMRDALLASGEPLGLFEGMDLDGPDPFADRVTHSLDVRPEIARKLQAQLAHRTQYGQEHPFQRLPGEHEAVFFGSESYIQARPRLTLPPGASRIADLCHGVSDEP